MKLLVIFFLIMISQVNINHVKGQTTQKFKGHIIHNNNKVLTPLEVRVESYLTTTNSSGYFDVALPAELTQIRIEIADKRYMILYPINGRVLIPKDPKLVTDIIIADLSEDKTLSAYINYSRRIEKSVGGNSEEVRALKKQLDSVTTLLTKQYNLKEADLRSALELQKGREKTYAELSELLNVYVNEAKDLENAFKYVADYAFQNQDALKQLIDAINSYNAAYEKLNTVHQQYYTSIKSNWQSDELAENYNNLTDFALNDLHKSKILPLNTLCRSINDYVNRGKKDDNFKIQILNQIQMSVSSLNQSIQVLNDKTNVLLTKLQAKINPLPTE
ncbi:hypothetical protein C3K47_13850 [Solitalea longa]|uniref:Uncharacterized protein n=1 Tax=Solitalea longa TaxID=2079460 RepID=A0A2S4ZZQ9_9SPHI|nr:hypothetical protein [Solitalea longa]POY35830.1 hypothetical protein C3K47_13850 [Solitalea longa]